MTKTSGAMAVAGLRGDNMDIDWMIAIAKKYIFAKRLNY